MIGLDSGYSEIAFNSVTAQVCLGFSESDDIRNIGKISLGESTTGL